MEEKILVPVLGESITEATVSKWLKNEGDNVDADEPLVELETDKVNLEVPSPVSGVLKKINSKDGTTVEVGALLGLVVESAVQLEKIKKIEKIKPTTKKDNIIELDLEKEKKGEPKIFDKISNEIEEKEKPLVLTKEIKEDKPLDDDNKNQNLSPAVRKMVAENKIDINTITMAKEGLNGLSELLLGLGNVVGQPDSKLVVDATGTLRVQGEASTIISGNLGIGVSNIPDDLSLETERPVKFQGKKFEVGNKIPTIGLYNKGDIVWDDDPKPNGTLGWICIRTGTPGEWRTFGSIGA